MISSFILGVIVGVIGLLAVMLSNVGYSLTHDVIFESYDEKMLKSMEILSSNIHRDYGADVSSEVQAHYMINVHSMWKAGKIPDSDYHLHQALACLRYCISAEKRGKINVADKTCSIAEHELELWNNDLSFEDFRSIVNSEEFVLDILSNKSLKSGTPGTVAP